MAPPSKSCTGYGRDVGELEEVEFGAADTRNSREIEKIVQETHIVSVLPGHSNATADCMLRTLQERNDVRFATPKLIYSNNIT